MVEEFGFRVSGKGFRVKTFRCGHGPAREKAKVLRGIGSGLWTFCTVYLLQHANVQKTNQFQAQMKA